MTTAKAGRREWFGLAVIALPCAVYAMDLTVLNLALPALSEDLQPSSAQLLWIVDIYGFLVAGLLITMGTLGDRIGRRRLLLIGAGAFGLASVFAALSTSAEMLIAARALLGVAGATLAPSTLSLIRNMFERPDPAHLRDRRVDHELLRRSRCRPADRRAAAGAFLVGLGVPAGAAGDGAAARARAAASARVPRPGGGSARPRQRRRFRSPRCWRSSTASRRSPRTAWGRWPWRRFSSVWGSAGRSRTGSERLADPLIDLSLFRAPAFNAALSANTFGFFVNFGIAVFIAQYLQLVLGLSPLEAGLWTVPYAGGFIVGSLLTPLVVRRIRPAYAIAGGLVLAGAGFGLLAQVDGNTGLATVVTGTVVLALGLAPVYTLAADLMVGAAPAERAGAAAGVSETSSELGGALGIAVLGAVGTAVYRGEIADMLPSGVPPGSGRERTRHARRGGRGG